MGQSVAAANPAMSTAPGAPAGSYQQQPYGGYQNPGGAFGFPSYFLRCCVYLLK